MKQLKSTSMTNISITILLFGLLFVACIVVSNKAAIKQLESHNHDGIYLSKSAEQDVKKLIEKRLMWLRQDLKFDTETGIKADTNDVLSVLLKRLHLKIKYIPRREEGPKIIFHYHFPKLEDENESS